jgi:predicted PurR-regulated permease PerM
VPPVERAQAPPSQTRVVLQVLLIIVSVGFGLWALYVLASVVLVLVVAVLFAYVIAPLVKLAERPIRFAGQPRHLSRVAAIVLIYTLLAGCVLGGGALLLPSAIEQANDIILRAPADAQSILTWEHGWSRYYGRLRIPAELRSSIDQSMRAAAAAAVDSAKGWLLAFAGALSHLPWLILVPIVAFFLLKDASNVRRAIVIALPYRDRLHGHRFFEELNATLAAFVRAQLLACAIVGTLCGLGFAALGIPYAVLLGVLAGVLEFIPLVGPLMLAVAAAIVGALQSPVLALWAVGFLGVLRLVEDFVIYPRLIGRGIALHPLAVIVAVLAGANLAGVAGVFLAVPTVAVASIVYRHWLMRRTTESPTAVE